MARELPPIPDGMPPEAVEAIKQIIAVLDMLPKAQRGAMITMIEAILRSGGRVGMDQGN